MTNEEIKKKEEENQMKELEVIEKELEARGAKAEADKAVEILRKKIAEEGRLPATDVGGENGAFKLFK